MRHSPVNHPASREGAPALRAPAHGRGGLHHEGAGRGRGGAADRGAAARGAPAGRLLRGRGPPVPRRALRRRGGRDAGARRWTWRWTRCCSATPRRRSRPGCARWTSARAGAGRSSTSSRRRSRRRSRSGASGSAAPSRAPGRCSSGTSRASNPKGIEPTATRPRSRASRGWRGRAPLEAGEIYAGLVVDGGRQRSATVDLGNATGDALARRRRVGAQVEPDLRDGRAEEGVGGGPARRRRPRARHAREARARARRARAQAARRSRSSRRPRCRARSSPSTRRRAACARSSAATTSRPRSSTARTQAKRQPGSAFKPFVWGAAVESRRFTPATVVYDTPDLYRDPWTGKEWKPRNFEKDAFDGPMLLARRARPLEEHRLGEARRRARGGRGRRPSRGAWASRTELPRNLTLALGTGEVTPHRPRERLRLHRGARVRAPRRSSSCACATGTGKVLEENAPAPPPAVAPDGSAVPLARPRAARRAGDPRRPDPARDARARPPAPAAEAAPPPRAALRRPRERHPPRRRLRAHRR